MMNANAEAGSLGRWVRGDAVDGSSNNIVHFSIARSVGKDTGGEEADRYLAETLAMWAVLCARWVDEEEVTLELRGQSETAAPISCHELSLIVALERPLADLLSQLDSIAHGELGLRNAAQLHVAHAATGSTLAISLDERCLPVSAQLSGAEESFDIQQMAESWLVLLQGAVLDRSAPIGRMCMISRRQRVEVTEVFNRSGGSPESSKLIHQLFEACVERTPEATALVFEGRQLTYSELNRAANRLANCLQRQGIGPEVLVGLVLDRGIDMVVAMLAVLKAGGAYAPLDPDTPVQRLNSALTELAPRIVLTTGHRVDCLSKMDRKIMAVDLACDELAAQHDGNPCPRAMGLNADHLAFVVFTSGSTGKPKAAMNRHRGMVNRLRSQSLIEDFEPTEICCHRVSVGFVDAVFEVLGPLSCGLPLVIVPKGTGNDSRAMAQLLARERVTRLTTVPSLARVMADDHLVMRHLTGLRVWTLSGEQVSKALVQRLQRLLPQCDIIDQYGASEVSSDAACGRVRTIHAGRVPVGRPVPNTSIYVLDHSGELVPPGALGEIYVSGVGVGRGYLNGSSLTAERFIADPFGRPGGRMYRTGDLGRWRSDGQLECFGRRDRQVKIRGMRVELGEIEARILEDTQVHEAVVIAREAGVDDKHLVAYLVLRDVLVRSGSDGSESADCVTRIQAALRASLPAHMVPAAFVTLDELPKTSTGKLNRRALPPPSLAAYSRTRYVSPKGPKECVLAQIWEALLGLTGVGRLHHFFELGGHSLLAVRMVRELRERGFSVDLRSIYECANLQELAIRLQEFDPRRHAAMSAIPAGCQRITPEMLDLVQLDDGHIQRIVRSVPGGTPNIQDIYPLTPLQHGLLLHHIVSKSERDRYVRSMLLSLPSRLAFEQLTQALQAVIDRHDMLRTSVLWESLPQPLQVVQREAKLPVEVIDVGSRTDLVALLEERMVGSAMRLSLSSAPLLKLQVAVDADGRHHALLLVHHLVFDDESLDLMLSEVSAHLAKREGSLPEPGVYRHHVAHTLAANVGSRADEYFRSRLAEIIDPVAPFGVLGNGKDAKARECIGDLDPTLQAAIRLQAHRLGVTPATIFHAAWALVVSRTTARPVIVFGSVLAGRAQSGIDAGRTLGMFINTLPLQLSLVDLTASELVRKTHQELVGLLEHEHLSLADVQRCSGVDGGRSLFSSLLNFRHAAQGRKKDWTEGTVIRVLAAHDEADYPIAVSVDDYGASFRITAQTHESIVPERVRDYLTVAVASLVRALARTPDRPALTVEVLPEMDLQRLQHDSFGVRSTFPRDTSLGHLLEAQVRRAPEAVAVIDGESSLTYAQFDAKVNRLASLLVHHGARPGDLIAVAMTRSLTMLIAQLAVIKAGAAYVPLDPRLPRERQTYIVEDCRASLGLIDARAAATVTDAASIRWLDCSDANDDIERMSAEAPIVPVHPDATAYVMYTSGSTGRPKGVPVTHRNVAKLAINGGYGDIGRTDCVAHCSNPAFDAAAFEIWAALLNGARLVIVSDADVLSTVRLAALLRRHAVTVLFQTTALFNQHVATMPQMFQGMRYVFFGGEAADPVAVRKVLQSAAPRHLLNMYGPTETTTYATSHEVNSVASDAANLPIGKPIANTRTYILDERMRPVPVGVTGELYIAGDGVTPGYLERPGLTSGRFIADPFSNSGGARMYRTGDLAAWNAAGEIDFRGRNDQQVKLRGYRIELSEIESQIRRCMDVDEAVVMARKEPRGMRLVAYVSNRSGKKLDAASVRARLKAMLPDYMVPAAVIVIETMPITSNGKIDRHALPRPDVAQEEASEHVPPEGDVERALAKVWSELLGVKRVGRDDNFFDLGGHSLLGMQVVARIGAEFSIDLPLTVLFKSTTLAELAAKVDELRDQRLLEQLQHGGGDIDELLDHLVSLPEGQAEQLLRELEMEGRA